LADSQGNVTTVTPRFNSLLLFDVRAGSTHQVLPVGSAANGEARLTIGGWLDCGSAPSRRGPRAQRHRQWAGTKAPGYS
jgi:hypothetical protein